MCYAEPGTWDSLEQLVDDLGYPLSDDDEALLACEGIHVQLTSLGTVFEPSLFSAVLEDQAWISRVSMAVGSSTVDDAVCDVFLAREVQLSAISAGLSKGVTPEHLLTIWNIPFDDAARTLEVRTQLIGQDPNLSLSCNVGTNDGAVRYRRIKGRFFTDTLFATAKAKSLCGNTCAQLFVLDKDYVAIYLIKREAEYILALKWEGDWRLQC